MRKNAFAKSSVFALMIAGLLMLCVLPEGIVMNASAETQTFTTDADFNAGIMSYVEVADTGTDAYLKLGALESSSASGFGTGGVVVYDPSTGGDVAYSVAVDSGFVYVAGFDLSPGNAQWHIEKRDIDTGALVSTFDGDGVVESNPSIDSDYARSMAIDMSYIYVAGYDYSPGNYQWRVEKRDKTTGALVSTFDGDGVVESNPSIDSDRAQTIAVDSEYIYVAGYDKSPGNYQWRIEKRDKTTGALVSAFDGDGVVENNPSIGGDEAISLTIDSDYIYISGSDDSLGDMQWHIEKRDKVTGALVPAFDGDGIVQVNPSADKEYPNSIVVDSNYIYVGGSDGSPGDNQWRIEKRDINTGALVPAFDGDGVVESNPSIDDEIAYSITVDSGYVYVTGSGRSPGDDQWRIEKRDINTGALVPAFDGDGVVESNPSTDSDVAFAITADSGYVYAAGFDNIPGNWQWHIEKRDKTTGILDSGSGLGVGGTIVNDPGSNDDRARSIAVDSNYMYVAGYDSISVADREWRIEKREISSGSLVTSFDGDGVVLSNPSSGTDTLYSIAIDASYMYLVGRGSGLDSSGNCRIEKRNLMTGALVPAFDGDGIIQTDPSVGTDLLSDIVVDANYIYAIGHDQVVGDLQWRVEKRDKNTGALVTAFDGDGVVQSNWDAGGIDYGWSIAIDSNYIYLGGDDVSPGDAQWRVEKRHINTGALVTSFDGDGILEINPSGDNEGLNSLAVDSGYIYIAGYDVTLGDSQWRIEKRNIINGGLVSEFDGDGILESNPSGASDSAESIAVDSNHICLAGYDSSQGNSQWRIEKRDKTTGTLDTTFDGDGISVSNPSSGSDIPNKIVVDSNFIYVAGYGDNPPTDNQWRIEKHTKGLIYPDSGIFTSPVIDASDLAPVQWSSISWNPISQPSGTTLKFQIAINDDAVTWNYAGPDGTENTYYEAATGQAIWSGVSGKYLKYKAYFDTSVSSETPVLNDVTFIYNAVPDNPLVEITSPNGGEDWMKDDHYPITWVATGNLCPNPITIYWSPDNGDTWNLIAVNEENDGIYNWTVPNQETADAIIRVVATDIYGNTGSDTSDASFAIDPPPLFVGGQEPVNGSQDTTQDTTTDEAGTLDGGLDFSLLSQVLAVLLIIVVGVASVVVFHYRKKSMSIEKERGENKKEEVDE